MAQATTEAKPTDAKTVMAAEGASSDELRKMDAYWRACTYLAAGMIYLRANPLLRTPLKPEHVKQRLLGHWGTSPGLSFTYIHLNRLINKYDLDPRGRRARLQHFARVRRGLRQPGSAGRGGGGRR